MKILMIFMDMLRPNLMHTFNNDMKESELDRKIKHIGGTLYTNCISPGPDSPRSLACLWSGLYPAKNGCDKRIRWPGFYLVQKNTDILDVLESKGFIFNFFLNPNERILGYIPSGFNDKVNLNQDFNIEYFLNNIEIKDSSLTYLSLSDFHWAIDDFGPNMEAVSYGYERLANLLTIIGRSLDFEQFDLTIIFSDHGFKLDDEILKEPRHLLLNRDRLNHFMLLKKKGDAGIRFNNKLASIMDVYPTVCDLLGVVPGIDLDGISLLSDKEHDYIVSEDHSLFRPQRNQVIDLWSITTKDGIYFRTFDGHFFENEKSFSASTQELDSIIEAKSSHFEEYVKEEQILEHYRMSIKPISCYTDGTKRIVKSPSNRLNSYKAYWYTFLSNFKKIRG